MSVSQVKKRFAEMESYLGRDKEALRRLKLLKDDVNVLRTSLAAAEEKAAEAEAVREAARKRADDAERQLLSSQQELDSLQQQLRSLIGQLNDAIKPDEEAKEPFDQDVLPKHQDVKAVLKKLRKMDACLATPVDAFFSDGTKSVVFNRNDIAQGWAFDQLWKLGASVAVFTMVFGRMTIQTQCRWKETEKPKGYEDSALAKHLFGFLKHSIDLRTPTAETVVLDSLSF
jgi:hypothetical protein